MPFNYLLIFLNLLFSQSQVTELKISTDKIEIEEGSSFKLNVIVLPNEAENKEVKWSSKDENVAKVNNDGTVIGIKEGKTSITIESVEGKKTATCEVTIKKKPAPAKIKLDNLTSEANEFNAVDFKKLQSDFMSTIYDANGRREEYINEDFSYTELGKKVYDKYQQEINDTQIKKTQILNKLIDNKKTFILLMHTPSCDEEDFQVAKTAAQILKSNGYSYFYVDLDFEDKTLKNSKIDQTKLTGSIAIITSGNIGVALDPNVDSLKNESEVRNWLDKYIELK